MKVIQINSVYKTGSTGSIVYTIHKYLEKNNHESIVIYGRGNKIKEKNVYKSSLEILSKFNKLLSKITGYINKGNILSTNKIIRIIKNEKPNVVHIHNLNDFFVNEYRLLKYLATQKIHTIITLHSEQMYTGTCGYALNCKAWKENGCQKCPHLYISTQSKIDKTKRAFLKLKKVYSLFNKDYLNIVACTPWLEKNSKESILLKNFKSTTIVNGGDPSIYKGNYDIGELKAKYTYKKIILFVCPRLNDPIKGHQYIDSLSSLLPNEYKVLVVGKVIPNIKETKNAIYLGEIKDKKALAKYYQLAYTTVMLSQRECFPMVIVESLLCGTPVVAFNSIGPVGAFPKEYVVFTKYGDVKELCKAIQRVKADKTEILKYSHNRLIDTEMFKKYQKLYY